jgi:hypothetical protein
MISLKLSNYNAGTNMTSHAHHNFDVLNIEFSLFFQYLCKINITKKLKITVLAINRNGFHLNHVKNRTYELFKRNVTIGYNNHQSITHHFLKKPIFINKI